MRTTEDNEQIKESEQVFEIIYRWINWEYSQSLPDRKPANMIPHGIRIWKHECNCQSACNKIEKQRR